MKKTLLALSLAVGLSVPALAQGYPPIPPPRFEEAPGLRSGYLWENGHWHWNGREYVWRPGHWVIARAYYHEFVPGHWAERRFGPPVWVPAHWR